MLAAEALSVEHYSPVFRVCSDLRSRLEWQTQMNGQFGEVCGTDNKHAVTDWNGAPSVATAFAAVNMRIFLNSQYSHTFRRPER